MPEFETVARVGDIPDGEGRAFNCQDQMVAVFNAGGEYHAIDDMCPHMGASLAAGHLEDCVVTCPWHGWQYELETGIQTVNRQPLQRTFDVRERDGRVEVFV